MNKEVYKEMCSKIYEGEDWDRMINCLERKDKEIERLNNIINKAIEYIGNHKQRLERLDKQGAYFSTIEMRLCDELLNILKDKENE